MNQLTNQPISHPPRHSLAERTEKPITGNYSSNKVAGQFPRWRTEMNFVYRTKNRERDTQRQTVSIPELMNVWLNSILPSLCEPTNKTTHSENRRTEFLRVSISGRIIKTPDSHRHKKKPTTWPSIREGLVVRSEMRAAETKPASGHKSSLPNEFRLI